MPCRALQLYILTISVKTAVPPIVEHIPFMAACFEENFAVEY